MKLTTIVFDQLTLDRDPVLGSMAGVLKKMAALHYDNRLRMPYTMVHHRGSREFSPLFEARMLVLWSDHGWLYANERKLGHGRSPAAAWESLEARKYRQPRMPEYEESLYGRTYYGMLSEALRYSLFYMDWIWRDRPELRAEAESALVLGDLA